MSIKAIIWDFGGVFTSSPFETFAHFERERGLPENFIRMLNSKNPNNNAWAKFERAQVSEDEFDQLFAEESAANGYRLRGKEILALLTGELRPGVVKALSICNQHFKTGCITNNMPTGKGSSMTHDPDKAQEITRIFANFDHVIESVKLGIRKPEPEIYQLMCEALDISPEHAIYIDDLGINLKPARAIGMTTIKAISENQIIADLTNMTGLTL